MTNLAEVAVELKKLERPDGRILPEDVVAAAENKKSPLHSFFEWDPDEAAKQYRLAQARQLIGRIKIEVQVEEITLRAPHYVRDLSPGAGDAYRDILRVRSDADVARDSVLREMTRVNQAARRAKAVAAVLGEAGDIDKIIDLAESVLRTVRNLEKSSPVGTA
jgi:hypothetical protein